MDNKLVSIIIPTYKRNDTLLRAIDSAYAQTYKNIEVIVVDDNAEFPEIRENNIQNLKRYPKLVLIQNAKNLGGGLSRNAGIDAASGEYIAFLDDDDEYLPNKIEKQMKLMISKKDDNAAVISCYGEMINVDGSKYCYKNDNQGMALLENIENCIAPTSFWLGDKKKILSVGGFENISSRQDASLLMKLMINGYTVYRVPEILLKYYWHNSANGISGSSPKSANAEIQYRDKFLQLAKKFNLDNQMIREALFIFSYRIAREYVVIGMRKDAFRELLNMSKIHLWNKKNFRVFTTIIFNRSYRQLSKIKNSKRVGC